MFNQGPGGFQFGLDRSFGVPATTSFSSGGENQDSNNAQLHSSKSMDDSMMTQTQGEKKKESRPKQTLFPITLKMALNASNDDNEVQIHGKPLVSALMVCQVLSAEKKNASFEFRVTDTTATLKASYYYSAEDEDLVAELEAIQPKHYVRIVGNIRLQPEPQISAHQMMRIKDHDEIPYHLIDSILFALKNQDPEAAANLKENPVNMKQEVMTNQENNMAHMNTPTPQVKTPMEATPVKPMNVKMEMEPAKPPQMHLRTKMLKFLQENRKEDGHAIGEISSGISEDAAVLRKIIDEALDDGDICVTIDDDHFAILD